MVKSFRKKRKYFKNNTKRNKQRRVRKNMIGGDIGDTESYLGNLVFVGYWVQTIPVTNWGGSDITTPIFVNKNFSNDIANYKNPPQYFVEYDGNYNSGGRISSYFPNNMFKTHLFDLLNPLNNDLITTGYGKSVDRNNVERNIDKFQNILVLPYLNLLPNVKNINIYKIILSRLSYFVDETGNKCVTDLLRQYQNYTILEKISEYIDLKYYKILEDRTNKYRNVIDDETFEKKYNMTIRDKCKQLKTEIMTMLDYGDGSYTYITLNSRATNTLRLYSSNNFHPKIPDNLNTNFRHPIVDGQENKSYIFLKDFIISLERAYPSLIARVILESDSELAGEEPRESRMRRASSIFEKGMEKMENTTPFKEHKRERLERELLEQEHIKQEHLERERLEKEREQLERTKLRREDMTVMERMRRQEKYREDEEKKRYSFGTSILYR